MRIDLWFRLRWFFLVGVSCLSLGPAWGEVSPVVGAQFVGRGRVEVEGKFFPIHEALKVELDLAEPHASVACEAEWTATALTNPDGTFRIEFEPGGACVLSCSDGSDYMVIVSTRRGATYAVLISNTEDDCK